VQKFESLCRQLLIDLIDTCQIAAACDKTKPDRVFADDEDDGDRRGFSLGRKCGTCDRGDHGHPTANKIGRQRRQPVVMPVCAENLVRFLICWSSSPCRWRMSDTPLILVNWG
jgi:hypothetical protein